MMDVINAVASAHCLSVKAMVSKSRNMRLVRPRWMAMRLLRDQGIKLDAIGSALGDRGHATVFSGLRRFGELVREDEEYRRLYRRLADAIAASETEDQP